MTFLRFLADAVKVGDTDQEINIPVITAQDVLKNGLNIAYFVLGVIAVAIIIVAGYRFMMANGDSNKAATARQTILYAAIGLIVVVSAFAITNFIMGRV
jgi:uncharacterized membrane protein YidH (DUF202 family)